MNNTMKKVLFETGNKKFPDEKPSTFTEFLEMEKESYEEDPEISEVLYGAMEAYAELIAKKFFYWWYNQSGSNTEQGFKEFIDKVNKDEIDLLT